jgi:hypothetical protein
MDTSAPSDGGIFVWDFFYAYNSGIPVIIRPLEILITIPRTTKGRRKTLPGRHLTRSKAGPWARWNLLLFEQFPSNQSLYLGVLYFSFSK